MVSAQQLNPVESDSDSDSSEVSGPKFPAKATALLRRMLAENKIHRFLSSQNPPNDWSYESLKLSLII